MAMTALMVDAYRQQLNDEEVISCASLVRAGAEVAAGNWSAEARAELHRAFEQANPHIQRIRSVTIGTTHQSRLHQERVWAEVESVEARQRSTPSRDERSR
ncbi:MAG: hypothetical protein AAF628_34050 [Planctomycetota bacterium]